MIGYCVAVRERFLGRKDPKESVVLNFFATFAYLCAFAIGIWSLP
jgi:hypothetical protein